MIEREKKISEKLLSFPVISVLIVLFVFLLAQASMSSHQYAFMGLPLGIIAFVIGVSDFEKLWFVSLILMPISLTLESVGGGLSLTLPTDPIAAGLMCVFFLKINYYKEDIIKIIKHPIGKWISIYLIWMFITSITAEKPDVAIKFTLSMLWHAVSFFFFSILFFKHQNKYGLFFKWILPALLFVVLWTIINHGLKGFTHRASYFAMQPFYKEHTAYAASIVFFAPAYFLLYLYGEKFPVWERRLYLAAGIIIVMGVISSYTRGAWLGLMAAAAAYFVFRSKALTKIVLPTALILAPIIYFTISSNESLFFSGKAKPGKSLDSHLKSVFNTKTDESNRERFNRWVAALNMVNERPITGFGPGNYAMVYAPFQEYKYKTSISTNKGDNGTTHSEYLLAASECGWPGMIIVILFYLYALIAGVNGFWKTTDNEEKMYYAIAFSGLITFYVHALVNNFLDQDKVAIPIFLSMAVITFLDIYGTQAKNSPND